MALTDGNPNWLFIVNPSAGNGKAGKRWASIDARLQKAGISYSFRFTHSKGHAEMLAQECIQQGFRHIVAVGGDGTGNEVVNGIFNQTHHPPDKITFTILPIGTGNDWVKTYRIPKQINKWLNFLGTGTCLYQDVGLVKYYCGGQPRQRLFINVAGLAYDAFLVKAIEEHKGRISNKSIYFYFLLKGLLQYSFKKARVNFDDKMVEGHFYSINVGICRYSGGGMQATPQALPSDGKLALTLMKKFSKINALFNTPRLFNGTIGKHPKISLHQARVIRVEALGGQSTLVEADGEFLGDTPVEFQIMEQQLRVWAPKTSKL